MNQKKIALTQSKWFNKLLDRNESDRFEILSRALKLYFGIIEEWKNVPEYERYYEISNFGRIRRISDRYRILLDEYNILNPCIKKNGYRLASLSVNSQVKSINIHRLVATVFIYNKSNKPCIDHKDTVKINNFFYNLHWVTSFENNNNPISKRKISNTLKEYFKTNKHPMLGKKSKIRGEKHGMFGKHGSNNPNSIPVLQFSKQGEFIKKHENAQTAGEYVGCQPNMICMCCNPEKYKDRKSAGGYVWKYEII